MNNLHVDCSNMQQNEDKCQILFNNLAIKKNIINLGIQILHVLTQNLWKTYMNRGKNETSDRNDGWQSSALFLTQFDL